MEENSYKATEEIKQKAFIASEYYIRRMLLPLQAGRTDITSPAVPYDTNDIRIHNFRGLSGVTVSPDEEIAKSDICVYRNGMFGDWFSILIPLNDVIYDISRPPAGQNKAVQAGILDKEALQALYLDEIHEVQKRIDEYVMTLPEHDRLGAASYEISSFFEEKRKAILNIPTGRAFINLLNDKGRTHDSNMTAAYLYHCCGIKGISYKDIKGERILLFDAKNDIEITDIWRESINR
jgi:hypothetical protein